MKLITKDDIKYLYEIGYSEKDIPQIKYAASQSKYFHGSKLISATKAIEIVGKKNFLSGIARSAFHSTAIREPLDTNDYNMVLFDSADIFK